MVPTDLCMDVVLLSVLKYYLNYVSSSLKILTDTSYQTFELIKGVRLWKPFQCRVGFIFHIIFIECEFLLICDVKGIFKSWYNYLERFQLWHLLTIITFFSPDTWEGSLLSAWNVCGTWERGNSVHTCSFPEYLTTGSPWDDFGCINLY